MFEPVWCKFFLQLVSDEINPCAVINMLCLFMVIARILDYKHVP
jgi:hypothetical protein